MRCTVGTSRRLWRSRIPFRFPIPVKQGNLKFVPRKMTTHATASKPSLSPSGCPANLCTRARNLPNSTRCMLNPEITHFSRANIPGSDLKIHSVFTTLWVITQFSYFIHQLTCPNRVLYIEPHHRHHKHKITSHRTNTLSAHGPLP